MTATWDRVKATLQTQGRMDTNGNTRRTRARVCKTCGAHVLVGFDGDTVARTATVDPTPLSPLGEALAVLAGRPTLELRRTTRFELNTRDHFAIAGHPAGTGNYDVLAFHVCWSTALPAARSVFEPKQHADYTGKPDF